MRGSLGDNLTTKGDILYDLSKVYQSLCGYDFLLLEKDINHRQEEVLAGLRDIFWDCSNANYEAMSETLVRDVKALTASHFFGIVPLHETRTRMLAFLQFSRKILLEIGLLQAS